MSTVTIFLTQKTGKDDIIAIRQDDEYRNMYKIIYAANDVASKHKFYLSERDTLDYVSDIFKSLDRDTDPFVHVQVSTALHPSIMYDVADLADRSVRWQVEDMIRTALRTLVVRVKA